jgi:hypothetical protein
MSTLRTSLGVAVLALGLQAATWGRAGALTRWVATNGSDTTGDGTVLRPWATITHALDAVEDGDLVLVRAGTYTGRVELRGTFANGVVVRSETPYGARLRRNGTVVICFYGQGIALEGFDIAHADSAAPLVMQIQDLRGAPGGGDRVSRITIRDNVIHDSRDNDLLKVNNGASDILVAGNMFYNQTGSDEHIDVNSVTNVIVQDNVFFNDFEGSGRLNGNDTSSYIVVKDSNGSSDGLLGSRDITIRRNVFLHWQGSTGANFVLIGEDGMAYHEAQGVLVENNLMLGDSPHEMRAPFGVKGGRDITFRNNTVCGNLPSGAFAMRLNVEGQNPANEAIAFVQNLWADPTTTMLDFSDTPPGETLTFTINRNLYWNGGTAIPVNGADLINFSNDAQRVVGDPRLPIQTGLVLPRWQEASGRFADGSATIRDVFTSLVERYGKPAAGSAAIDAGSSQTAAADDILGRLRPTAQSPDLGAYEVGAATDAAGAGSTRLRLHAGFPNPFAEATTLDFETAVPGHVRLDVYDVAGHRVRNLFNGSALAGAHRIVWDGRDEAGRPLPAGTYLLRLGAGEQARVVRCILLRGR